jgi:NaMN:DMB phosphoribosyltransferase
VPATTTDLASLGVDVDWPDHDAQSRTRDSLAATAGLGRLADLAAWLSGTQGASPPHDLARVRAVVFGGDPRERPAIAEPASSGLRYVADPGPVGVEDAVAAGAALADEEIDGGADLLIAACADPSTAAPTAIAVLTNTEPVKVLARGNAATDPDAWMTRAVEIRDVRRHVFPFRDRPQELLEALNRPVLASVAGFVLRAAARRTPVLLDGIAAVAAALVAYEAQPRAVNWWLPADVSSDPAHELALVKLGYRAVLGLGTEVGDGTAGLLAVAVLRAALRLAS